MGYQVGLLYCKYIDTDQKLQEEKPDHYLGKLYVQTVKDEDKYATKVTDILKSYEEGPLNREKIMYMVNLCLDGIKKTLSDYGIHVNKYVYESDFVFGNDIRCVLNKLAPFCTQEQGGLCLNLSEFGIEKPLILTRGDGTTLYATRDIAYSRYKCADSDFFVNIIGDQQKLEQEQVRSALTLAGEPAYKMRAVYYGLVSIPGKKMSARLGIFVSADEILEEAIKRVKNLSKDLPNDIVFKVVQSAVKYALVAVTPTIPVTFKWQEALNLKRNSAPYILYTMVRIKSILRKAGKRPIAADYSLLSTDEGGQASKKVIYMPCHNPKKL